METRVRFAPSPTGELHVGNARTALFNFLFARKNNGRLVLRIEDTDPERSNPEFEAGIIRDLEWLGIPWDEGPGAGGEFGPYLQSRRIGFYNSHLETLANKGRVYPCYCTEGELEAERRQLLARGQMPRYSGKCIGLSREEARALEDAGRRPALRFRIPEETMHFDDLIRGRLSFRGEALGDFIVMRSNGTPAYNFAAVVDDHEMRITHVIRGEDHLTNTALQLFLYRALGFEPPRFAHHALILAPDRTKLSKRHGSVTVRDFREEGILPEALMNYLALLGRGSVKEEVCGREELISHFSLDDLGKSGAVFDRDKLIWMNEIYIRRLGANELIQLLMPYLKKAHYKTDEINHSRLAAMVEAVRGDLRTLSDIGELLGIFFDDHFEFRDEALNILKAPENREIVIALKDVLTGLPVSERDLYNGVISELQKKTGLKGKKLFMPVRAAVTGRVRGPELEKIIIILGRYSLLGRTKEALARI